MKKIAVCLILVLVAAVVAVNVFADEDSAVTVCAPSHMDGAAVCAGQAALHAVEPLKGCFAGEEEYIAGVCAAALRREGYAAGVTVSTDGKTVTISISGSCRKAWESGSGAAPVWGIAELFG